MFFFWFYLDDSLLPFFPLVASLKFSMNNSNIQYLSYLFACFTNLVLIVEFVQLCRLSFIEMMNAYCLVWLVPHYKAGQCPFLFVYDFLGGNRRDIINTSFLFHYNKAMNGLFVAFLNFYFNCSTSSCTYHVSCRSIGYNQLKNRL